MAHFKEVTLTHGEKTVVNMDEVRTMERFPDGTTIAFAADHSIKVKETPDEILLRNPLRNL
jgi:uncharacterized protein YlzI (FlbEa/FlbD family)